MSQGLVLSTEMRARALAVFNDQCWWRLQRMERGDAGSGRSTAGSRLVPLMSAASERLVGEVGLLCARSK